MIISCGRHAPISTLERMLHLILLFIGAWNAQRTRPVRAQTWLVCAQRRVGNGRVARREWRSCALWGKALLSSALPLVYAGSTSLEASAVLARGHSALGSVYKAVRHRYACRDPASACARRDEMAESKMRNAFARDFSYGFNSLQVLQVYIFLHSVGPRSRLAFCLLGKG